MPTGMEPHDYEPSANQFAKMEEADLILVQGGLEPWLHDAEETLAQAGVPLLNSMSSWFSCQQKNMKR